MIEHIEGTHETVNYRQNTNLRIYDNTDYEEYPIHWHPAVEFLMPLRGEYIVDLDGLRYVLKPGDILMICPGVPHSMPACRGERYIIQADVTSAFHLSELNAILSLSQPALLINAETFPQIVQPIRDLLTEIADEYKRSEIFYESSVFSKLARIFVLIGRSPDTVSGKLSSDDSRQKMYSKRFMSVCTYIDRHCTEDLSLDEIADLSGFSKYHFSRLFRQFTGFTFYRYLNQQRIAHAQALLADPDHSVLDVALSSGFSSMSAFVRMFRILKGCTPSQFRKMFRLR